MKALRMAACVVFELLRSDMPDLDDDLDMPRSGALLDRSLGLEARG